MPPGWFKANEKTVVEHLDHQLALHQIEALPNVKIEVGPIDALCLLSVIQLALRHPRNDGPASKVAREFARRLQDYLSVGDEIRELCEKGWDPKWDEP